MSNSLVLRPFRRNRGKTTRSIDDPQLKSLRPFFSRSAAHILCSPSSGRDFLTAKLREPGGDTIQIGLLPGAQGDELLVLLKVVAGGGIEPPTQGFSVLCSTN